MRLCEPKFNECEFENKLLSQCCEDQKLAVVIYYKTQSNALKWINTNMSALGNHIPLKSIISQPNKLK